MNHAKLCLHIDALSPYGDATRLRWLVQDSHNDRLQLGELKMCVGYGPLSPTDRSPPNSSLLFNSAVVDVSGYRDPVRFRNDVWALLSHWERELPGIIIEVSGGWAVWSHLFHRMVHDDTENRKRRTFPTLIDVDMAKKYCQVNGLAQARVAD